MIRRRLWGLGAVAAGLLSCTTLAVAETQGRSARPFSHLGRGAEMPVLGVDARGDQTVAWTEQRGNQVGQSFSVMAATRLVGGHWGAPARVSNWSEDPVEPLVAVNASGAAVITWIQVVLRPRGYRSVVEARTRSSASATWGRTVNVASAHGTLVGLQAGIDNRGEATLVWSGYGKGHSPVMSATGRTETGRWHQADTIGQLGAGELFPQLAVNGRGDAVVLWQQAIKLTGSGPAITIRYLERVRYRPSGGHWGQSVTLGRLSEPSELGATFWAPQAPDIALDARGDATVMWLSIGRAGHAILLEHRLANRGHWTRTRIAALDLSSPVIGADASGGVTVAWGGRHGELVVDQSKDGVTWSYPRPVPGVTNATGTIWLAVGQRGNAILAWFASHSRIFVSVRRRAAGRWTRAAHIGQGIFPQAALTRNGTAAIIWLRSRSPKYIPVIDDATYPTRWARRSSTRTASAPPPSSHSRPSRPLPRRSRPSA